MSRFEAVGNFVYEKGDRIGCTPAEAAVELARKLNAYQMRVERFKAEIEMLSKPAIIGGYNISEYIRMANSETLEFDNGDMFADMTLPERIKYIVESHARLKAEVERLTKMKQDLFDSNDQQVEHIERLTKAGDATSQRLHWFCQKWGWKDDDLKTLTPEWNAAKEGKQP